MCRTASAPAATRLFNRNFLLVSLINLLTMTVYYLLVVVSVPYLLHHFDISQSAAGLVTSIIVIGCLAGRFLTGSLVARLPFRTLLMLGLAGYACVVWGYCQAGTLAGIFCMRFLAGFSVGVIGTVTATLVAYIVPTAQRGLGVSYFTMSTALALAAGPMLGLFLIQVTSYANVLLNCLGIAIFCILLPLGMDFRHIPRKGTDAPRSFLSLRSYISYRVIPFSCFVVLVSPGYSTIQAFIAPYAAERQLMAAASLFFLVYGAAVLATRPISGRIFDKFGENLVMYPSLLFMVAGLLLLAGGDSAAAMLTAAAMLGIGFGNFQSSSQAIALSLVTPDRFAQAISTFFIFFDLGVGIGPWLLGVLVPAHGYDGVFLVLAVTTTLSAIPYHLLHGRKHPCRRP